MWWRALIAVLAAAVLTITGYLYFSRDTPPPPRIIITKAATSYPLWTDTCEALGVHEPRAE